MTRQLSASGFSQRQIALFFGVSVEAKRQRLRVDDARSLDLVYASKHDWRRRPSSVELAHVETPRQARARDSVLTAPAPPRRQARPDFPRSSSMRLDKFRTPAHTQFGRGRHPTCPLGFQCNQWWATRIRLQYSRLVCSPNKLTTRPNDPSALTLTVFLLRVFWLTPIE